MAPVGVAEEDRQLIADDFAATAGKDPRQADTERPALLDPAGGKPSDAAVVRQHGARIEALPAPAG